VELNRLMRQGGGGMGGLNRRRKGTRGQISPPRASPRCGNRCPTTGSREHGVVLDRDMARQRRRSGGLRTTLLLASYGLAVAGTTQILLAPPLSRGTRKPRWVQIALMAVAADRLGRQPG